MPAELVNVKIDALSLSEDERAELAEELLASLDGSVEPDVKKAWDVEICRRVNEIELGKAKLVDAKDALASVRQRLNLN